MYYLKITNFDMHLMKLSRLAKLSFLLSLLSACGGNDKALTIGSSSMPPPQANSSLPAAQIFKENRSQYAISVNEIGYAVKHLSSNQSVQLSWVNRIEFADVNVNLRIADVAKSIAEEDLKLLIELYIAFLNRTPDADGLAYWIGEFRAGKSIDSIAQVFYQAAQENSAITGYSATMSNADFVRLIYKNVLARTGDLVPQVDVDYWANELTTGHATRGALVKAMLDATHGLKGNAQWGWMSNLLDNKYQLGRFIAVDQGISYRTTEQAYQHGTALLALVTPTMTPTSIEAAVKQSGFGSDQFNLSRMPAGIYVVAGDALPAGPEFFDGPATHSRFTQLKEIALDSSGNRYVLDELPDGTAIRKISPDNVTSTIYRTTFPSNLHKIVVDSRGKIYFSGCEKFFASCFLWSLDQGMAQKLVKMDDNYDWPGLNMQLNSRDQLIFASRGLFFRLTEAGKLDLPFGTERVLGQRFWVDDDGNAYFPDQPRAWTLLKLTPAGEKIEIPIRDLNGYPIPATYQNTPSTLPWYDSMKLVRNQFVFKLFGEIYTMDLMGVAKLHLNASRFQAAVPPTAIAPFSPFLTLATEQIQFDAGNNVVLTDPPNFRVVSIDPEGKSTLLGGKAFSNQGLLTPTHTTTDRLGNIYVLEGGSLGGAGLVNGYGYFYSDPAMKTARLTKFSVDGTQTVLFDRGIWWGHADVNGYVSELNVPVGVAVDRAGNLYIANSVADPNSQSLEDKRTSSNILKITPDGKLSVFAGGRYGPIQDGIGNKAVFGVQSGLSIDAADNLYVSNGSCIRKITPKAEVTCMQEIPNYGISVDGKGNVFSYVSNRAKGNGPGNSLSKLNLASQQSTLLLNDYELAFSVQGIAADSQSNVYLALSDNSIRRVSATGEISVVAKNSNIADAKTLIMNPRGLSMVDDKTLIFLSGQSVFKLVLP